MDEIISMPFKDPEEQVAYSRKYYLDHKEKAKEYGKKYNKEHSEQKTKRAEEYNSTHPEKRRATGKRYREKHSGELKKSNKMYRINHEEEIKKYTGKKRLTLASRYSTLKSTANRRGLACFLSLEDYKMVIENPCYYCGGDLPPTGSGTDRVDSSLGYVIGNVRACCMICNRSKSNSTENEFKDWIVQVYNHWGKP